MSPGEKTPGISLKVRRLRGKIIPGLKAMEPAIEFAPQEITNAKMFCSHCCRDVAVPLKKVFPEPHTPVFTRDYHPVTNNSFLQLVSVEVECPECSKMVRLELPTKPCKRSVTLYGDEALRHRGSRQFCCLSLVGGSLKFVQEVRDRPSELKTELEPARSPDSWRFHMKEIWSGHRRQNHSVFKEWKRETIEHAIAGLARIIREANTELFVFVSVYVADSQMHKSILKRKALMFLMVDTMYNFTRLETSPHYVFDADRNVESAEVIQDWARRSFLGTERQLLYLYLSHGVPVPEPKFVKQGSHACLELADFVSFIAARELFSYWEHEPPEISTESLGEVYYSWVNSVGQPALRRSRIPSAEILGDA
jgi:hypothetical protein